MNYTKLYISILSWGDSPLAFNSKYLFYSHYLYICPDVQEQFCFGEEIAEVQSFEKSVVSIARSGPACNEASILVHLSFIENGLHFGKLNALLLML